MSDGQKITCVGPGRIVLVSGDGERIVLEPGQSITIKIKKQSGLVYRVACAECGIATGVHETWCPHWEPY